MLPMKEFCIASIIPEPLNTGLTNDIIAKIVTQIMVIILNYVFSKVIIFKKK